MVAGTIFCMSEILIDGRVVEFDEADGDLIAPYKWRILYQRDKLTPAGVVGRYGTHQPFMHRLIMGAPRDLTVDHIDRNPLNNRRSNLRLCTFVQNMYNRPVSRLSRSGIKGVRYVARKKKWEARITQSRKHRRIGYFRTAEEASAAYKAAALNLHGEFACTA